jgi:uncharacterized ferritin-like protein (DUF455 family)
VPDLFSRAWLCLSSREPDAKLAATEELLRDWRQGLLGLGAAAGPNPPDRVGRPQRPELVHPRRLPRRSLATEEGRLALLHAVAHIEFNAINLALDAVYRFRGMPPAYYEDWVRVAAEEAAHFRLLRGRLRDRGRDYGDFPAHDGLWDMARRTAHDPLVRMALVPRVLEARGLDVTPGMIERLRASGDRSSAEALEVILAEEVGHVEAGSRWFRWLCEQRGLAPEQTFFDLIRLYLEDEIRCPLHREARRRAGFSETELQRLEALCGAARWGSVRR